MKETNDAGAFYLLSTPIGNLEDMTFRAVRILKEADLVAAEDTRRAVKLLNHFDIKVPLTSYHMHNERSKTNHLIDRVLAGEKVVVLSDAGTPVLADPGFFLVREAVEQGIEPIVIPGVSALTFAVAGAGLPVDQLVFGGFLPVKKGKRLAQLENLMSFDMSVFLFESPYKIDKLLEEIQTVGGPETNVVLAREATKIYEEFIRGTVAELITMGKEKKWKGEFVVVIDAKKKVEPKKPKKNKYSQEENS